MLAERLLDRGDAALRGCVRRALALASALLVVLALSSFSSLADGGAPGDWGAVASLSTAPSPAARACDAKQVAAALRARPAPSWGDGHDTPFLVHPIAAALIHRAALTPCNGRALFGQVVHIASSFDARAPPARQRIG